MWQDAHDAYLESRILSADPLELLRLLYQAATSKVRDARRHLAEGDIQSRSRSITRVCEILIELAGSLDHERGGEISARLAQLYDYLLGRLIEANLQQSDEPLAEALGLLTTLSEAWEGIKNREANTPPPAYRDAWAQPLPEEPVTAGASHRWSL